ncbi:MAG TPA: hypothetical protein VJZ04_09750 [Lachnospiraceae bacterium]|nr:hypothetical protein [Lachnospiraceae bacterium]
MEERTFKVMARTGAFNLTLGIITLVAGLAGGILLIVSGAKLLSQKTKIMF